MSSNYTVVFDACVMYPAPLRSFLIYLAVSQEFRARWTDMIHDEWVRNLLKNRPDLSEEKLNRTRQLMDENVLGALVTGYEGLIDAIELPDPDDRHVLAAAIQTNAEAIITFNLADFPEKTLSPYGITALHPDEFISSLAEMNIGVVIGAARQHRSSLKKPPSTVPEYLDILLRQNLPKTVAKLKQLDSMI